MPLTKTIQAPTGAVVSFHKAMQAAVDVDSGKVNLNVASWASADDYVAGAPLTWMWPLELRVEALSDIDAAVATISPFDGAAVLADPAVTLSAVQARTWTRISNARDAAIYAGLYVHAGISNWSDVADGLANVAGDPSATLGAWVTANLNAATALRAQIDAATSIDELNGLTFPILP